jgi:recombination protein RecR
MLPDEIKRFIDAFARIPSIGPRQATRLAFRFIGNGPSKINELTRIIHDLGKVKLCDHCFFVHTQPGPTCQIDTNPERNNGVYMIVEKETDLMSIERTGRYSGRYLILGELTRSGALEAWQKLRLNNLKSIIQKEAPGGKAREIIVALNPTTYGDLNASLIEREMKDFADKFSRLGRGIPTGGEIEFADEETLLHSLERRE